MGLDFCNEVPPAARPRGICQAPSVADDAAQACGRKLSVILIALLALLGVNLIVIVVLLAGVLSLDAPRELV